MLPNILTISGSLREGSSTHAVLEACEEMMLDAASSLRLRHIPDLPPFDDRAEVPTVVKGLRYAIMRADAVLFCTPEYAFGIPGALKNMLDWTVGDTIWTGKPVAVITAATGGEHAHRALLLTLTALGTARSDSRNLLIPFIRTKMKGGKVEDAAVLQQLGAIVRELIAAIGDGPAAAQLY